MLTTTTFKNQTGDLSIIAIPVFKKINKMSAVVSLWFLQCDIF